MGAAWRFENSACDKRERKMLIRRVKYGVLITSLSTVLPQGHAVAPISSSAEMVHFSALAYREPFDGVLFRGR
jgi:hypothetical protein